MRPGPGSRNGECQGTRPSSGASGTSAGASGAEVLAGGPGMPPAASWLPSGAVAAGGVGTEPTGGAASAAGAGPVTADEDGVTVNPAWSAASRAGAGSAPMAAEGRSSAGTAAAGSVAEGGGE